MWFLFIAFVVLGLAIVLPLFCEHKPHCAAIMGTAGAVFASVLAIIPMLGVLVSGQELVFELLNSQAHGPVMLKIDPLSAFFSLPVLVIAAVAAIYGYGYLKPDYHKKKIGVTYSLYNLLVLSMMCVLVAEHAILFLVAWELMAVASFGLVMFHGQKESASRVGTIYLIAAQIGAAALLVFFILLGTKTGSFDFDGFRVLASLNDPKFKGVCFLFALVGFGTKAGIIPLHTWLPEAHPAAPSHVSALMSGVMIKMGIYGIVRTIFLLSPLPNWAAWVLLCVGISSGIYGVLFALAQHDIKRLLAYHSIENIGIILMGLAIGLLGQQYNMPVLACLGWIGGLFHVVNHAIFKSLLFFGAGAVIRQTGEHNIELMGGLLKRMPVTGFCFLIAAMAICGLPPFNGFASEFLIYCGAFKGLVAAKGGPMMAGGVLVVLGLALIGGLALACFSKAFGIVFLGEPRSEKMIAVTEVPHSMTGAMIFLAAACFLVGVVSPWMIAVFGRLFPSGWEMAEVGPGLSNATGILLEFVIVVLGLIGCVFVFWLLKKRLFRNRTLGVGPTWDCGYLKPHVRMQYTGSSFAQPLTGLFQGILKVHKTPLQIQGIFPKNPEFETHTPDVIGTRIFGRIFEVFVRHAMKLRRIQHGNVQIYILYILVTLLVLFVWRFL